MSLNNTESVNGYIEATDRTFENIKITCASLETKVKMSAKGNKMTDLEFDIWDI